MLESDANCCLEDPSQTDRQIMISFTMLSKNIPQEEKGKKRASRSSGTERTDKADTHLLSDLRKSNRI